MSKFEPQGPTETNSAFAQRRIKYLVNLAFKEGREILVGHRWPGGSVTYVYEGGSDMLHLLDDLRTMRERVIERKYLTKAPTIKKLHKAPKHEWRGSEEIICVRCLRAIQKGDRVHIETFYDNEGPIEYVTHQECRKVNPRPRLHLPQSATVTLTKRGIRRAIMSKDAAQETTSTETTSTETKATKKAAKKGAAKKSKSAAKKGADKKVNAKANGKKSTTKKAPAKKAARAESSGSMSVTVGTRLQPLMKGNKNVGSTIKALAAGEDVSHKKLVDLREEVKVVAAKFREDGKNKDASQLSSINQLVRRLERAAR